MNNPSESGRPRFSRARLTVVASALALLFLAALYIALRPSDGDNTVQTATGETAASVEAEPEPQPPAASSTAETATAATTDAAETTADGPTRIRITVAGGRAAGGIARQTVRQGADVLLVVRADVPETVHLHGYDREATVAPNAPAQIGFTASQPGRFEVELEESGVQIAELTVEP